MLRSCALPQLATRVALALSALLGPAAPAQTAQGNYFPPYILGGTPEYVAAGTFVDTWRNDQRFIMKQLVSFLDVNMDTSFSRYHLPSTYPSGGRTLGASMMYTTRQWWGVPRPLVIYCHGTELNIHKVPSTLGTQNVWGVQGGSIETPAMVYYAAKLNAAVFAIDYPGMGADPGPHPYCQYLPLSAAVLDAIPAGIEKMRQMGLPWDGRVLVTGYSEGGYAAVAAMRRYHEDPAYQSALPHKVVFAGGAGPYDMSGTMVNSMFSDSNQHPNPFYLAYLVTGWQNPVLNMHYVFQPWLWGNDGYFPGMEWSYSTTDPHGYENVNNLMTERAVWHTGRYSTRRLLTDTMRQEQYETSAWPNTELGRVLRANDLHGGNWWISAPAYLFSSMNDDNVPYDNQRAFMLAMNNRKTPGIATEQAFQIIPMGELNPILSVLDWFGGDTVNSPHSFGGIIGHVQAADYFLANSNWDARWPSTIDFPRDSNSADTLTSHNQVTLRYRAPFHGPRVWIGASRDGQTWQSLYQGTNTGSFSFVPSQAGLGTPGPLVLAVKDLDADNPSHDWNRNRVLYSHTQVVNSRLALTEPAAGAWLSTDPWCTLPMTWTGVGSAPLRAEARLVGGSAWTVVGRYQGQWTSGGRYLFPSLSTPGDYEVRLVAEDNTGNASDPVRVHVVRSIGMNMPGQVNRSSTYSLVFAGEVPANIELRLIQNDTGTTTTVYSGPRLYNWNVSPSALGLTAGKSYTFVLVNRATGYGMGHSNSFYVWSQVGFTNPKAGATLLSEFAPHMVSWNQTYGSFDLAWSTNGTTWTKVGTGTGHSPLPALPSSVYGKVYLKVTDTQYSGNSATTWVYYY